MRTTAFTGLAVLLVLPTSAIAQAAAAPSPSAGAPPKCVAVTAQCVPATGNYKYAFGNEHAAACLMDKDFSTWCEGEQKQFLALSTENILKFALFAGGDQGYHKFLQAVEDARLDKQTGSSPTSEGTTSAVSKGLASQVLALAVDSGALTRTDNKSIATFRGNALGIARLLAGHDQFPYCAIYDYNCESTLARHLDGFSFNASFDTTPASGTPAAAPTSNANTGVLASGRAQTLAGWGLRYDFNVRKNPLASDFQKAFLDKMNSVTAGKQFVDSTNKLFSKVEASADFVGWKTKYLELLRHVSAKDTVAMANILNSAITDLVVIAKKVDPGDFQNNLDGLLAAMGDYFGTRDRALEAIINKLTVSLEYEDDRPQNQPNESTVKVILSYRPQSSGASSGASTPAGPLQLTFNGSAGWYDQAPPQGAVKRFRDAQASLQADRKLPDVSDRLGAALTLGYYFQYMADNALLKIPSGDLAPGTSISLPGDASVLLNTKGSIHIAQLGLTLTVKGTGIRVPVMVSYSNRTDLIKANDVRGHFGVSYDLDSLFAGKSTTP
jgi:hypothetical protein